HPAWSFAADLVGRAETLCARRIVDTQRATAAHDFGICDVFASVRTVYALGRRQLAIIACLAHTLRSISCWLTVVLC
mgnify:CR=1